MFSKLVFPFLGVVIGGVIGGIGGTIAGFFIAEILHGAIRGLYFRSVKIESNSELDSYYGNSFDESTMHTLTSGINTRSREGAVNIVFKILYQPNPQGAKFTISSCLCWAYTR